MAEAYRAILMGRATDRNRFVQVQRMGQQVLVAADGREQALQLCDQALVALYVGVLKMKGNPSLGVERHTVVGFGEILRLQPKIHGMPGHVVQCHDRRPAGPVGHFSLEDLAIRLAEPDDVSTAPKQTVA